MAGRLEGKVALVTGGGSGIGRASALAFAAEGASVMVADVDVSGGEHTVELIGKTGGAASFVETDVREADQVEAMVEKTVEAYGRLDCAHNNAGVEGDTRAAGTVACAEESWDQVLAVNLKGVWLCLKYEIPEMLERGGAIVNTASVAGLVGFAGLSAYTASKHGVVGLTKSAALEYASSGVRVNAICPGVIQTPMVERSLEGSEEARDRMASIHPAKRLGSPEEIAEAAVYLCQDSASFTTGIALPVDGGLVAR